MSRFDEFLRTGILGPVRVGASQEEIRQTLGPPHGVGNPEAVRRPFAFWSFGGTFLQIFFEHRVVTGFGLYFWHSPRLPPDLSVTEIPFTDAWTMAEVIDYLWDRRIRHRAVSAIPGEPPDRIVAENATSLIFDHDGKLQKILAWSDAKAGRPTSRRTA